MEVYFVEFKLMYMYSHNTENCAVLLLLWISKAFNSMNAVQRWAWQARSRPMLIATKAPFHLELHRTGTHA